MTKRLPGHIGRMRHRDESLEAVLHHQQTWHIEQAHVLDALACLPDGCIHAVITSPPYWGLRDYNLPARVWGGDASHDHEWLNAEHWKGGGQPTEKVRWQQTGGGPSGHLRVRTSSCMCGAWRGSVGLEPSPFCQAILVGEFGCGQCYLCHLCMVMDAVRRVLRDDGMCLLNIGDSYTSGTRIGHGMRVGDQQQTNRGINDETSPARAPQPDGMQPLNLCLIPQRLAIALQVRGWAVRSWIVAAKKAPMPESVSSIRWQRHQVKISQWQNNLEANRGDGHSGHISNRPAPVWQDCPGCARCSPTGGYLLRRGAWRPTSSHEAILMLAKSPHYWADGEAVKQSYRRLWNDHNGGTFSGGKDSVLGGIHLHRGPYPLPGSGANLRDVWTLRPEPFPGQHFAVFPTALPTLAIQIGCPARCCAACGAGWVRIIHRSGAMTMNVRVREAKRGTAGAHEGYHASAAEIEQDGKEQIGQDITLGWRPLCPCPGRDGARPAANWLSLSDEARENWATVPGLVLDPFSGAGTTVMAALRLGRRAIGIELNEEYCQMARRRIEADATLLNATGVVSSRDD